MSSSDEITRKLWNAEVPYIQLDFVFGDHPAFFATGTGHFPSLRRLELDAKHLPRLGILVAVILHGLETSLLFTSQFGYLFMRAASTAK